MSIGRNITLGYCYIVIKMGFNVMGDVTIGFFLKCPETAGCRGVVVCIVILL